jgi:hypothetical protein
MLLNPFNSLPVLFAQVCLTTPRSCCEAPLNRRYHGKSTRVDLNLLSYAELFRLRRTTLRVRPPLYNPHSCKLHCGFAV